MTASIRIKRISTLLILALSLSNSVYAGANFSYQQEQPVNTYNSYNAAPMAQYPQNNVLQGNVVMVPAGTSVKANVTTVLSSEYLTTGQGVTLSLNNDFYYAGKLVAPAGSYISGTVVEASKAKHGSMNGKLCIRFNMITTPYGTQIPIAAMIKTDDGTGVLVGGTKMDVTKEYAKDVVVGSAAGALSGVVFGALAGGSVGRGAALGTAVGAGGGLAKSVWDKGNNVEIPAGAAIELMLTQPMTVSIPSYQFEN